MPSTILGISGARIIWSAVAVVCALGMPTDALAQSGPAPGVFAVLEFSGPKTIPPAELALLSDQARGGALKVLKQHGFLMITRESMVTLLREMGISECAEGECEIDTLQSINADFGITGNIVQVDGRYFCTLKLFDARRGALLGSLTKEATSRTELVRVVSSMAETLVQEAIGEIVPSEKQAPEMATPGPAPSTDEKPVTPPSEAPDRPRLLGIQGPGRIGVGLVELTAEKATAMGVPDGKGVLIPSVQEGGPAEEAGIRAGDVILEIDGVRMSTPEEAQGVVSTQSEGAYIGLEYWRDGQRERATVRVDHAATVTQAAPTSAGTPRTDDLVLASGVAEPLPTTEITTFDRVWAAAPPCGLFVCSGCATPLALGLTIAAGAYNASGGTESTEVGLLKLGLAIGSGLGSIVLVLTTLAMGAITAFKFAFPGNPDATRDATALRGPDGTRFAAECPAVYGNVEGEVVGSNPYAVRSSICAAAVHAGAIKKTEGGKVTFSLQPGVAVDGSEKNEVKSTGDGAPGRTFLIESH